MKTALFTMAAVLMVGSGCGQPTAKVGTGKPGEFSREAVEKAAFPENFPAATGGPEVPKSGGRRAELGKAK